MFHTTKTTAGLSSLTVATLYDGKNPVTVEADKKAALARATGMYAFDEHLEGKSADIQSLVDTIREYVLGLDEAIEEVPKKYYVAYKVSQNIVCEQSGSDEK
ncbi:DUF5655 domain-containing protein [Cycloclasticus pugetii]|uniref:DUF5655 domain-containing protein n=1 Tax=Cycloclasticus pugetii TaxID=34068 RepID=UPI003A92B1D4